MDFSDSSVSGRCKRHGLGGGFGLLCEGICLRLKGFGNIAGRCDDETRGHGSFGDEGAIFVGRVHSHFEIFGGCWGDTNVERAVFWEGDFDGVFIAS